MDLSGVGNGFLLGGLEWFDFSGVGSGFLLGGLECLDSELA